MKALLSYLAQRPDTASFVLPKDMERSLRELFSEPERLLPEPYKIFPADETQPATLGFPVSESGVLRDLESRLDRWLAEETAWQVNRAGDREKAQSAFGHYVTHLMKIAENAMMSNILADYHAVFWLTHSFDLARHCSAIPRRIAALDVSAARALGDTLKYRIYGRWVSETRDQMQQLAVKAAPILDGEEQRGLQFFRLLQDDVLILTEEFVSTDLRELRSFIPGYLRTDFQAFRDSFERLRAAASDLVERERSFRALLPLFGAAPEQGITLALLLDPQFQSILFEHPSMQNAVAREEREQFQLIGRRVREFAVLNQLRRGITWMTSLPGGQIVPADSRNTMTYSRSTRPMDFGRTGVVDPMVHRFGMIYDITAFSETLGNIRRGGEKEEIRSYRQMLLFQRRLEAIAQRHLLQFEKFLGDGAFYTTRRALRLIRAAAEIQHAYSEMKRKGFSFNKGLRIALNYGYYRLLPMRTSLDSNERITEFYGPGIVELSRLTTGKATKEIEELSSFLLGHGYDETKVRAFFAPLAHGVDVIDHEQHARSYYAYVDGNGHLVNEGIVASAALIQELSNELGEQNQVLFRIRCTWGTFIGFAPAVAGVDYVGLRLLGMVALKGLDRIEIAEVVPFSDAEIDEVIPLESGEPLAMILRHEFHQQQTVDARSGSLDAATTTTTEHAIETELVICVRASSSDVDDEVLIGEWDPRSDDVHHPLRLPRGDFQRLFSLRGELTAQILTEKRESVREMYTRLALKVLAPDLPLAPYRDGNFETYVLGEVVEKL